MGRAHLPLPGSEARGVRALLRELGVIEGFGRDGRPVYDERHLCHAPQERLFIHGRWQEGVFPALGATGEDRAQLEAFRREMERYRRWRDGTGRRAFATPRAAGAPGPRSTDLDGQPDRRLHAPRAWLVGQYPRRLNRSAETSRGPPLLRGADPIYQFTWPEQRWLTRQLAGQWPAGSDSQLVINVEPAGDGAVVETFDAREGRTVRLHAREVVLAVPVFVAARIYRPWRERPPAFVSAFHYAPWLVANLHLDRPPAAMSGAPLAWDNVLYDSDGLGYVVATHQSLRTHAGATVLTYYRPFPGPSPDRARRALLDASWTTLREGVLRDLARPHPGLTRDVRRLDIMRYGHAMVRPEVGFVCGPALAVAASALAGPVHLAHADLSGFSIFEER